MDFFKGETFNQCILNALDAGMEGHPAYCFRSGDGSWRMGWLR